MRAPAPHPITRGARVLGTPVSLTPAMRLKFIDLRLGLRLHARNLP